MRISRRGFMAGVGAIGGSLAGRRASASTAQPAQSSDSMGMLTDLSRCVGCRRCEWACNEAHGLPNVPLNEIDIEAVYGARRRMDANSFTVVNRFGEGDAATYVKRQCMHCVDPACVSACPVKAFVKPAEGAVTYNEDLCMGCRYCMVACPFDVPAYEYDNPLSPRVRKCTMCFERFESGGAAPACASICPQEAITYGKREDLLALARQKFQNAPGEYVDHIYGEREAGGTNWLYISKKPFEELGFNCGLGDKPYPDLTKGYLAMVPLVHSIWPMLLMGLYAFSSSRDQAAEPGQHGEEEVER